MNLLIKNVRLVGRENVREDGWLRVANGVIAEIGGPGGAPAGAERVIDGNGLYLAPGLIDLHTHGAGGGDFMDATEESFVTALGTHLRHGTTTLCPTTVAASNAELKRVFAAYRRVKASPAAAALPDMPGVHMEGPFIAPATRGAQDARYIVEPTPERVDAILDIAGRDLLIWTLAPELPGGLDLCDKLRERGVYASLGHSDAQYKHVLAAVKRGMTMATHLFSGMSTITREDGYRRLGAIESALLLDEMWAEIIADGDHLPPELLRLIVKCKGVDRLLLVTDSMRAAGMPEGTYILGSLAAGTPVLVYDGIAHMPDKSGFAGSVATADRLVRVMRDKAGVTLCEAVRMMTENPARAAGLTRKGRLAPGMDADMVLFDEDIRVRRVFLRGAEADMA